MLSRRYYEPFELMNQWRHDLERAFRPSNGADETRETTAAWLPAVDIKEDDGAYVLHADVPGVDPKDIEVHMENGVLTLKGERQSETRKETDKYTRVERVSGSFYRRFTLPDTADAAKVTARCANGVLEVRIPKHEKHQPRRVEVQA